MVYRQRFLIDRRVQGALIGRVVIYWLAAILYVGLTAVCFQYWEHKSWTIDQHLAAIFHKYWPWIPSMLLFLPLVVFDIVRLSSWFAGPIYRLHGHLSKLVSDPNQRPLSFRKGDYWSELVSPVNCLQEQILALQEALDQTTNLAINAMAQAAGDPTEEGESVEAEAESTEANIEREEATDSEEPQSKKEPPAAASISPLEGEALASEPTSVST